MIIELKESSPVTTEGFPYGSFSFSMFNPVQSAILPLLDKPEHCLICANTGSGKTEVAEIYMSQEVRKNHGRAIYLSPFKSLSQEKFDKWTDSNCHLSDLKISICTGDYQITADRKKELDESDIVIMTYEILNSLSRSRSDKNSFLKKNATLVIDECFPGHMKVRVDDNIDIPIKQIVENDSFTHVLAYDSLLGSIQKKKILRKITKQATKNLVSVHHEFGQFTCTEDHKIWTLRGYIKAKELLPSDSLKWIPLGDSLKCNICNIKMNSKRSLMSHYIYKHIDIGGNTVHNLDKMEKCFKCDKEFSSYGIKSHIKYCGIPKKKYIREYKYESKRKYFSDLNIVDFVCPICFKQFDTQAGCSRHLAYHNPDFSAKMRVHYDKFSLDRQGKNNPIFNNPETIEKMREISRKLWSEKSDEDKIAQINRFISAPRRKTFGTKLELLLEEYCVGLAIERTSGGKYWVKFDNKSKNPDFRVIGQDKVIEVGDTEYWHTEEEIKEVVENYKKIGINCLYLTDVDIKLGKEHVRSIVDLFINNHASKVISVRRYGSGRVKKVYDLEVEDCHNYFVNGTLVSNCHSISDISRGNHVEIGILNFLNINPNARIIALSATLPNYKQIGQWISKITNRDLYVINSDYRPCTLHKIYENLKDKRMSYYDKEKNKINRAIALVKKYPNDKFILFVHGKKTGRQLLERLEDDGIISAFHNADLDKDSRVKIENNFRSEDGLRVIIATSTLSAGVNLPAKRVVILGVHRGISEVEVSAINQSCGRAGRPQYIENDGFAHILLPETKFKEWKYKIENPPDADSSLIISDNYKNIAFHIVSEIHHGGIVDRDTLHIWFKKTLASHQHQLLDNNFLDDMLDLLKSKNILIEEDGFYSLTALGKISSMFYYSPYDVSDLARNFAKLFKSYQDMDDHSLSLALSDIDIFKSGIVSKADLAECEKYVQDISKKNVIFDLKNDSVIKTGFVYYLILHGKDNAVLSGNIRGLKYDFGRTLEVLSAIDSMYGKWQRGSWWNELGMRMNYGIPWDMVKVCKLNGIGSVKVRKLWNAGIKNYYDIFNNPDKVKLALACSDDVLNGILDEARCLSMSQS